MTQSLVLLSRLLQTYDYTITCAIVTFAINQWWHYHLCYCHLCYKPMMTQSLVPLSTLLQTIDDTITCAIVTFATKPLITQSLVPLSTLLQTIDDTITCAIVTFATNLWLHNHLCYCHLCYKPMVSQSLVLLPTLLVLLSPLLQTNGVNITCSIASFATNQWWNKNLLQTFDDKTVYATASFATFQ